MPQPGYKQTMTDDALRQRQEAPLKHGVYSKKITPEKAAKMAELESQLSTRPGVVNAMIDQAAKAIQVANVAAGYVAAKHNEGIPLDRIPLAKSLPAFFNTANRALGQLFSMLPDESQMLDESTILQELRRDPSKEDGETS